MNIKTMFLTASERREKCCAVCGKMKVKYQYPGNAIFKMNFCSKICVANHCIKLHKIKELLE